MSGSITLRRPANTLGPRWRTAVEDAATLLPFRAEGCADGGAAPSPQSIAALFHAVAEAIEDGSIAGDRHDDAARLALELADLESDARAVAVRRRLRRLEDTESSLRRLTHHTSTIELVESVCRELVVHCGFARAMVSGVEDGHFTPWTAYFADDHDFERRFVDIVQTARVPLGRRSLEHELIDQRRAICVADALADARTGSSVMLAGRTRSFVAAAVEVRGEAIGFLHADHYGTDRTVDEEDREVLDRFAAEFGRIYERVSLLERLAEQRRHVRETLERVEQTMEELCATEFELSRRASEESASLRARILMPEDGDGGLTAEMTPREREVLSLLLAGHGNAVIAEQLVISSGTVKSHVKQILRKLGVSNRSEAIAACLGLRGRLDL